MALGKKNMGTKQLFFKLRDKTRFMWARSKFGYIPNGDVAKFDFNELEHVVILKLDGKLGDTQVMTHFYSQLRSLTNAAGHKLFLSAVCPKNLKHIYKDILGFDCVIESSRKPKEKEIELICEQIIQAAVDTGYSDKIDLVLSTEPNYRPRDFIFNHCLKPKYVAGCDKRLSDNLVARAASQAALSGGIEEQVARKATEISFLLYDVDAYDKRVSQAFCEFMQLGKLEPSLVSYKPLFTEEELEHAQNYLACESKKTQDSFIVGVNPSAASQSKLFTPEVTAAILSHIISSSDKTRALLLCHRGMSDYIDKVIASLGEYKDLIGTRIVLMPKESTACDLAALIHCSDAQIGVDTATVHLACSAKIRQLCFYNNDNTESRRWAPLDEGELATVIRFADANLNTIEPSLILKPAFKFIEELVATQNK